MKAIVKTQFPGRPDGEAVSRQVEPGETIEGALAEVAVANKWASAVGEKKAKGGDGK